MSVLELSLPEKVAPLFQPKRYKALHGGRGGGKSHTYAELIVLRCYERRTNVVCIREVQNSIRDSVKRLIESKIEKLGLTAFFDVKRDEVRCPNGSLIIFKGMQAYNAENIKSLEDFDIAWVEEAQTLSEVSWRMLRPTIRKDGSEIWCSWNPRWDTDAVDKFFRGANRPANAEVIEINWDDNPWFPGELQTEKDQDYANDPEMAEHVWGGGYEVVSEGAYYARLIAQAEKEGRVGYFPYDPGRPVDTAWDIGVDDYTAIWFIQNDGLKATVLDYWEASGDGAEDIISAALPEIFKPPPLTEKFVGWSALAALSELGREQPFKYGLHYFPHDIRMREWGAGARSRVETARELGVKDIKKGVPTNPQDRIAAVRRLLPLTRFNFTPRVELGLRRARRYRRKFNDQLQTYMGPLHDENSHGADALGEYAMNCPIVLPESEFRPDPIKELVKPRTAADIYGSVDELEYDDE